MDSSKSLINYKLPEADQDRLSNLPSVATDKILKRLPLQMAAKMGVVSTKWRDKWVSFRHLVFDEAFWDGDDVERVNSIIVNILLHHIGPLHKFHLFIPDNADATTTYLSQWLSFLSRSSIKKITLRNQYDEDEYVVSLVPSHIFACKELVKLRLEGFALNRPPSGFKGFAYLRSLELVCIEFKHDILGSLITSCPGLTMLKLEDCTGMNHLVIDAPSLKSLVIIGECAIVSLHFKSVEQLNRISLCLEPSTKNQALGDDIFNLIKPLSTSCQIQYLQLNGHMCKVIVNKNAARHKIKFNESCKLDHLTKMKITGSSAELQFLEYMLSISVVLEILLYRCSPFFTDSELNVSRNLLSLRRASAKAQLVCLDQ